MPDPRRPWIDDDRADALEPEHRPIPKARSDEIAAAALARLRLATQRPGWRDWLEVRMILWQGRRIRRMSDRDLVDLVRSQQEKLLHKGLKGKSLRIVAAGIREMTGRKLGMRHHPVQIMGGLALLRGKIVEMATGEGKTITTLIPAISASLAGVSVHVVTVNEYLAQRDCELLSKVIEPFGLSVGVITADTEFDDRPQIYTSDIVFSTNKDIAFDYLRDRIKLGREQTALATLAQRTLAGNWRDSRRNLSRGLGFAIVDEADSILIDEAQTPLIITAEGDGEEEAMVAGALLALAGTLAEGVHYQVDNRQRSVRLLKDADPIIEGFKPPSADLVPLAARRERLVQALSAIHLYRRDEHYVVTGEGVAIVDEFTGRVMADRQWQRGLHQMIESKEAVEQSAPRNTLAQITYQTYFARYQWFAGMTGTARKVARELTLSHNKLIMRLPTHRALKRRERRTRLYGSAEARWKGVVDETKRITGRGRPVLIGTRSVEASETVADHLQAAGLKPEVLNARQDADEAEIVAGAGAAGRITVATNMAGRGTDIPVSADVSRRGGLHVILTEFHGSARIDRQFIGRTGRQGQTGTAIAHVSLDDRLFTDVAPHLTAFARLVTMGRRGRLSGWIGEALRIAAQAKSERLGRARRAQTVRRSKRLSRALGFRPDNI